MADQPDKESSTSSDEDLDEIEPDDDEQDVVDSVVVESQKWAAPEELKALETAFQDTAEEEIIYASDYINGIRPIIRWGSLIFRFPFNVQKKIGENSTVVYEFYWTVLGGTLFKATSIAILVMTLTMAVNMGSFFLNFPRNTKAGLTSNETFTARAEEVYQFYRHSASIVVWFTILIHLNVANYRVMVNRKFICNYLGYTASALRIMKLNSAEDLGSFSRNLILILFTCMAIIAACGITHFTPIGPGLTGFSAHLLLRVLFPDVHTWGLIFQLMKYVTAGAIIYCMVGAKIFPILFITQCQVIKKSLELWNQRLDIVLNRGDDFLVHGNRLGKRTGFRVLFEDHTILIDLINGADTAFSEIIDSYFFSQVISLCFEWYFLWRCLGGGPEFHGPRIFDSGVVFVYTLHSCTFLLMALFEAAGVAERSYDGLEAVRRQGVFGRKSPEELYFLMSIYMSFQGHFETATSGAGYFAFNADFIATVAGAIICYFIVLIQFSHPFTMLETDPLHVLVANEELLVNTIEQTQHIIPGYEPGV